MGQLNPNLSFFGGGWDAVVILVEGCDGELRWSFLHKG